MDAIQCAALLLVNLTTLCLIAVAQSQDVFVCYDNSMCAENVSRPVFTHGESIEGCCGMPHVTSALNHSSEECNECGPPVVERVSPYYIALTPPETLILEIAPTGYTRITWLFRGPAGEDILPLDPRRFELEDYSKRAMLLGTVAADRGVYEADVHTINGDVITVDFFVGTIVSTEGPTYVLVLLPANATILECQAEGFPTPTIQWLKDGQPLGVTERLSIETTVSGNGTVFSVVQVERPGLSDIGWYTCAAENPLGNDTLPVFLFVYVPPSVPIVEPPVSVAVPVSGTFILTCRASGIPPPQITWFYGETELSNYNGTRSNITTSAPEATMEAYVVNSTLVINDVRRTDAGQYNCSAENPVGISSTQTELFVLVPPTVSTDSPTNVTVVLPADEAILECQAEGFPTPTIQWFKDGQPLEVTERLSIETTVLESGSVSSVVRVEGPVPVNDGLYECVAENNQGRDVMAFVLTVHGADVVIGFLRTAYAVNESSGNVEVGIGLLYGSLQNLSVDVNVSAMDNTARGGSDFIFEDTVLTFTLSNTTVFINVEINADGFAEREENFLLEAVSTNPFITVSPNKTTINIIDDDSVVIGFRSPEYEVSEVTGYIVLSVEVLQGNIDQGEAVWVIFYTEDGTALGGDYNTTWMYLRFTGNQTQAVTIWIYDDAMLELDEDFFVNLVLVPSGLDVLLNFSRVRVVIADDDNAFIDFSSSEYHVSENDGRTVLRIEVTYGDLGRPVELLLSTRDGTAEATMDYTGIVSQSLVLNDTTTYIDVVVSIVNDSALEFMEQFFADLVIVSTETRGVILYPLASINITDDDGATIGFESTAYMVTEEVGLLNVSAKVLSGDLGRRVLVRLDTIGGTADDIMGISGHILEFNGDSDKRTIMVSIMDDVLVERDGVFFVSLTLVSLDATGVSIAPAVTTITITDNDRATIGFDLVTYEVPESAGYVSVTLSVLAGFLGRNIVVTLSTSSGSATSTPTDSPFLVPDGSASGQEPDDSASGQEVDFMATSADLVFNETVTTHRVNVTINNDVYLEEDETLHFMISLVSSADGVTLDPDVANITIINDDSIVIGFEQSQYQVEVGESDVTLTIGVIVIYGQLRRDIQVRVYTESDTALDGKDFVSIDHTLTLSQGVTRVELNITLTGDQTLEPVEQFIGHLEVSHGDVIANLNRTTIQVIDSGTLARVEVTASDTVIQEGSSFSLVCAAFGDPTPKITWLKDSSAINVGLASDPQVSVTEELINQTHVVSTLTVNGTLPSDSGEYKCRIDNHIADNRAAVSASADITVLPLNECIFNNPCQNGGTCVDEVGGYGCQCTMDYTGVNCTEEATQQNPPTIVNEPDNVQTMIFQPINLTCEAVGEPNPTYSWYRDGIFLVNTTKRELFISQARPQDRGEYTCVAHNVHGSSNASSPALVTISGVFQYIANFSDCRGAPTTDFMELVSLFSDCSSSRVLQTTRSTVYSISPRLVRMGSSPEDQIVLTIVASSSTTEGIMEDLWVELSRLTEKFQCQFSHLRRYDGCPMEDFILNQDFDVVVTWAESEIGDEETLDCPCGNITGSLRDVGQLDRVCGGTYTYGAFWSQVLNECIFNNNTFQLCDITTLPEERQATALGEATEQASVFSPLDFTIAVNIMQDITQTSDIQTNELVQTNFTRSFSNLLGTSEESVVESQERTQSSALLLDSLEQFTQRILLNSTNIFNVSEDNFQIVIQDQTTADFSGLIYTPDVDPRLQEFQLNASQTPVQGASISLPGDLESFVQNNRSALRVSTSVFFRDTLFVQNGTSELARNLARGNRTLGNIIIAASLPEFETVDGPSVVIRYTLTKGLNETSVVEAECVFWLEQSVYGTWSNRGCRLVGIVEGVVTCECTHLTHFGLLMDISPEPHEDEGVDVSLQVITYVGVVLSVICLLIVLLTYTCSRRLRSRPVGKLLIHMSTALIGLYVSFLLAMHGEQYDSIEGFCYFCSFVLQYFFLVFLLWTSIEAFHTYLQLVRVFGSDISRFVLKASLVAWGLPALITMITLAVGLPIDQYVTKVDGDLFFCRPVKWPFYFGIAAPFVLIFVFNVAIFFVVMWSLTRSTSQQKKWTEAKQMSKEYKKLAVIAFTLSVLFGLGWAFGFLIPTNLHSDGVVVSTIAQYIFSILVGFHGVLIFLVYCLRSPEVRQEWSRWFVKYGCCFKPTKPPRTLTQTTGSKPRITLESPSGEKGFLHLGDKRNPIFDGEDDFSMRQRLNTSFNNNSNSEFASTWFTGEVSTHGNPTAEILEGEEDGTSGGEPLIK